MFSTPPLQSVNLTPFSEKKISVKILRLDLIHSSVNGNKWYKLKYNLTEAKRQNVNTLLTFGGAYSNHLKATANAAKLFGFRAIGIVRGDELNADSNAYLQECKNAGMELHFVSREDYRKKEEETFIHQLQNNFGNFYLIPEGGSNALAIKGTAEIVNDIGEDFDFICMACGTAGTIVGVHSALSDQQNAMGITVVNAPEYFEQQIQKFSQLNKKPNNLILNHDYHLGAYAKVTGELESFKNNFIRQTGIPIDSVYNAKLWMGLTDLIRKNYFPENARIVVLNTGGY